MPLRAQRIGYNHRLFSTEGCSVTYTPNIVNDTAYIVVDVSSENISFAVNPTMMVRFFGSDQVMQLSGISLSTKASHGGVMVSNVFVPITEYHSIAMFMVTEEQMKMFEKGVAKIRISTVPVAHERTFKNDKIGAKIYREYLQIKNQNDNF